MASPALKRAVLDSLDRADLATWKEVDELLRLACSTCVVVPAALLDLLVQEAPAPGGAQANTKSVRIKRRRQHQKNHSEPKVKS